MEKHWKVKLTFLNQDVVLPGSWPTQADAEWAVALWKQEVLLYTDPFTFYQEESSLKKGDRA